MAQHDHALRDELLFVVSPYLLEHADFIARTVGQVYVEEQHQQSCRRGELRHQFCELVFNSTDDDDSFHQLGTRLGFDATVPRIALAIDHDASGLSRSSLERVGDHLASAIGRHIGVSPDHLVHAMRHGRLVMWVPCARGSSLVASQRWLVEGLTAFASRSAEVRAIGIGFMNHTARGWAESASEAITALDLGFPRNGGAKVYLYSDIAIDESICSNRSALRYFESMLGEIRHEKDLLKTLEIYFDNAQHRKATAASLGIHPNTLNYRLDRIETLLGAKLDAPAWIARLFIALKLRNAVKDCLGS